MTAGSSGGDSEQLGTRTLIGHLLHPNVRYAVCLEHGCEKTHNDHFSELIEAEGAWPLSVERSERFCQLSGAPLVSWSGALVS